MILALMPHPTHYVVARVTCYYVTCHVLLPHVSRATTPHVTCYYSTCHVLMYNVSIYIPQTTTVGKRLSHLPYIMFKIFDNVPSYHIREP